MNQIRQLSDCGRWGMAVKFLLVCQLFLAESSFAGRVHGVIKPNSRVTWSAGVSDSLAGFAKSRRAIKGGKLEGSVELRSSRSNLDVSASIDQLQPESMSQMADNARLVLDTGLYRSAINTPVYLPNKNQRLQMAKMDIADSLFDYRLASIVPDSRSEEYFDDLVQSGVYKSMRKYIEKTAHRYQVDPALVKAVIAAESGYNPSALSNAGAIGLMQIIPPTGERYGVMATADATIADRLLDPHINVDAGTRYIRDLLKMFNNRLDLVIASYNAGEGAVKKYGGIPPYPETQKYVPRVLKFYQLFNPAAVAAVKVNTAQAEKVSLEDVVGHTNKKKRKTR